VEPLIIAFKEANPRWGTLLRAYARALTRFGAAGVEFLISTVEDKETDGWRREAAAEVLGQSGDPQAVEPLIAALKDKNWPVREAALRALQNLGWQPDRSKAGALYWIAARRWDRCVDIGPPAVEPLIVELKDGPTDVRRAAAQALGKIGDPRAGEALIAALRDAKTDVRKAAAQALHDLGWQPDRSGIGVG
jgi:HEAT repeat protein